MPPPPSAPPTLRVRGMILTAGVAAITVMGSIFGASLKTDRDVKKKQATIVKPNAEDELIAALESRRMGLVQAKMSWEKKAEALRARVEANRQRVIGGASERSSRTSPDSTGPPVK